MAVTATLNPINEKVEQVDVIDGGSKHVIGANRGDFSRMACATKQNANRTDVQLVETCASENGKVAVVTPVSQCSAISRMRFYICRALNDTLLYVACSMAICPRSCDLIKNESIRSWHASYFNTVKVSLIGNFLGTSGCGWASSPKLRLALSE
jgi:hypothetical protein